MKPLRRKRIELTKLGGIQPIRCRCPCDCIHSVKGVRLHWLRRNCDRCICHRYALRSSLRCADADQRGPCPSGCGNFWWLRRIRGEFVVCVAPLGRDGCCVAGVAVERSRATCLRRRLFVVLHCARTSSRRESRPPIRPVLKHGPRSLTCARVIGCQT